MAEIQVSSFQIFRSDEASVSGYFQACAARDFSKKKKYSFLHSFQIELLVVL